MELEIRHCVDEKCSSVFKVSKGTKQECCSQFCNDRLKKTGWRHVAKRQNGFVVGNKVHRTTDTREGVHNGV